MLCLDISLHNPKYFRKFSKQDPLGGLGFTNDSLWLLWHLKVVQFRLLLNSILSEVSLCVPEAIAVLFFISLLKAQLFLMLVCRQVISAVLLDLLALPKLVLIKPICC